MKTPDDGIGGLSQILDRTLEHVGRIRLATFEEFAAIDLRIGTVLECRPNPKARKPAYILSVDFGEELGTKTSSAQLTQNYQPEDLLGRQVIAVVNFPPKIVAGVSSEILVLGGVDQTQGVVLLAPDRPMPNGTRIA